MSEETTTTGNGKPDPADVVNRFNGDVVKMAIKIAELEGDNYRQRDQLRDIKGKVPADGSVVLTADQAALWQQYQDLGNTADLKQRLADLQTTQDKLTKLERDAAIAQGAEAAKYNATVLGQLQNLPPIHVKDVTADGKTTREAFVTVDDKEQPLTAYVEQHYAVFLPALRADAAQGVAVGPTYPAQRGNSQGQQPRNPGETYVQNTYKRPRI